MRPAAERGRCGARRRSQRSKQTGRGSNGCARHGWSGFPSGASCVVNQNLVAAKLLELDDRIGRIQSRCPPAVIEFGSDRDAIDVVSYNVMLAVQSCADIASHIIAGQRWPAATSLAGAFARLCDQNVISERTADALCRATALRNFIAHGYACLDPARIHTAGRSLVTDMEAFAGEIAR